MRHRRGSVSAGVAILLLATPAWAQLSSDPAKAPSGAYKLETAHSQILFSVLHLGLTDYYGRFDRATGTLNFDASQPERSSISVSIDPASADTASPNLNGELSGPNVFDTAKFPAATFVSTSIARTGPTTGRITGNLTLRGVTRRVVLDTTFTGSEPNPMSDGYSLGFKATTTIKRTDFGITGMRWEPMVGDDVTLIIDAMFDQEKS
jgi:polyisoprenoid-binding protein YceI